ncbi:DUF2637 domain-containing protein [Streptomyces sp. NPDC091268]|uniref:DUF2637 domain-containing protein n=1 Tax=Streptomyces sp. NPDC091268 TaxID=3365979 RepID=UPI00380DB92E
MLPKPRLDAVLVQAVIAGALSFAHLHDLAEAAGQSGWKAWAYPVSVDLLLVAAWRRLRLLRDAGEPVRSAWTWFTVALAASLGANVATAGLLDLEQVPAWLRILVAGWPALAFLGGTLLVHPAPADASAPESAPAVIERDVAAEPVAEPEPAPALPAPEPLPEPVPVPAALVEHARKLCAEHLARTGSPIESDSLRARLGVPPAMADAITAQLA